MSGSGWLSVSPCNSQWRLTSLDLPPRCSIEVQRRPATAELLAIGAREAAARVRAERTNIVDEWCWEDVGRVDRVL